MLSRLSLVPNRGRHRPNLHQMDGHCISDCINATTAVNNFIVMTSSRRSLDTMGNCGQGGGVRRNELAAP